MMLWRKALVFWSSRSILNPLGEIPQVKAGEDLGPQPGDGHAGFKDPGLFVALARQVQEAAKAGLPLLAHVPPG